MKLLIAIDGNACHYFAIEVSEARYHRPKYMEALYNSVEMVFKKLKYHKGKMDITINVIEGGKDVITNATQKQKRAKGFSPIRGKVKDLGPEGLPTDSDADGTWDTTVQEEISKRERQNKFLQGTDVEDLGKPKGGGII